MSYQKWACRVMLSHQNTLCMGRVWELDYGVNCKSVNLRIIDVDTASKLRIHLSTRCWATDLLCWDSLVNPLTLWLFIVQHALKSWKTLNLVAWDCNTVILVRVYKYCQPTGWHSTSVRSCLEGVQHDLWAPAGERSKSSYWDKSGSKSPIHRCKEWAQRRR